MRLKQAIFLLFFLVTCFLCNAQSVGIGTSTPAASAQLDVTSTSKGFLPPRMTYAERNAIVSPVAGLIIYCTDCANGEMQYYNGTAWVQMMVTAGSIPYVAPSVSTNIISSITNTSAVSGGTITSDGGTPVIARGVVWNVDPLPTISLNTKTIDGTGVGLYTSIITGLNANTSYHVRAYATNSLGTSYGGDSVFTTANWVNLPSVTICDQIWTTKNLDVSIYRNGDSIPKVTDENTWYGLTTGAYCYYNNDSATYAAIYGKIYNWYAVNDPRGLAPRGWHVPSDGEWNKLVKCIDPLADTTISGSQSTIAGGAMKEVGLTHWLSPNTGASNSSGFTGLPGGGRYNFGTFFSIGLIGRWWTSTESVTSKAWLRNLNNDNTKVERGWVDKANGLPVRCVRD